MNPFLHPEVVDSINNVVRPWIDEWKVLGHRRMVLEGNVQLFDRIRERFPEDLITGIEVRVYHGTNRFGGRVIESGRVRVTVSNADHVTELRYPING